MNTNKLISAILATTGALSLSISMCITKILDPNIPTTIIVFLRSAFGLLFLIPIFITKKQHISYTSNMSLHILRIMLGMCAMLCTYYSYRNLPITFATSIGMTSPIFIATFSGIILQEVINYKQWFCIICGYIGVLMVIRPDEYVLDIAIMSAFFANVLASICTIIIKKIAEYDSIITIMLYGNIGIFLVSSILCIPQWYTLDLIDIGLIALTGICGLITQVCSINALKLTSPGFIAPFEYFRLLFAISIGYLIFNETLCLSTIIGMTIIIMSNYIMILSKK